MKSLLRVPWKSTTCGVRGGDGGRGICFRHALYVAPSFTVFEKIVEKAERNVTDNPIHTFMFAKSACKPSATDVIPLIWGVPFVENNAVSRIAARAGLTVRLTRAPVAIGHSFMVIPSPVAVNFRQTNPAVITQS